MKKILLSLFTFLNTLGTILGVIYLFRFIFYPYNYLLALAHTMYKGESTFSTKGKFMTYAFNGTYGLISFLYTIISILITQKTGFSFPVIILFCLFILFGLIIWLPIPKKLRTEAYPKPNWYSYLGLLIIPLIFLIVLSSLSK